MAHCIHLSPAEIALLRARQTKIAHCPSSNFDLMSGIMSVHDMRAAGLDVGLGTDVSGGYSPAILDSIRQAIIASKALHIGSPDTQPPLNFRQGLYLATVGGSRTLGLSDKIGTFHVGKQFDALVIDPTVPSADRIFCPLYLTVSANSIHTCNSIT